MPIFSRVPVFLGAPSLFSASSDNQPLVENSIPTSGLSLWLRADLGITLAGTDVASWSDQSSSGYDVGQGNVSQRPGYMATNGTFNGMPTVEITVSSQNLTGSVIGAGSPIGAPDMTIIAMGDIRGPWATYATLLSLTLSTGWNDGWAIGSRDSQGNLDFWFNGWNNRVYKNVIGPFGAEKVLAVGRATASTNELLYRLNGVQVGTTSYGSHTVNSSSYLTVGGAPGTNYTALNSSIAEIIVYNRALSGTEILEVEAYLTGKYGGVTPVP